MNATPIPEHACASDGPHAGQALRRKSITVPGLGHGANPIPLASVIGHMLMSGAIFGTDRHTGKLPESLEEQCALTFDNVRLVLEAAGAGFEHVLKMTFYIRPEVPRELINVHWVEAFPEPGARPARHVMVSDRLPPGMLLQCDLVAHLPH